ncbi:MAG: hypothetical protein ACI867_001903 [Glaciecola sp.]|jgi:hypothetical protein
MITHLVLLALKDPADAQECADRLNAMAGKIDGLVHIHAGVDFSGNGFHIGLATGMRDRAALEAYASDPVHLEVLSWIKPRVANRALVDFEV